MIFCGYKTYAEVHKTYAEAANQKAKQLQQKLTIMMILQVMVQYMIVVMKLEHMDILSIIKSNQKKIYVGDASFLKLLDETESFFSVWAYLFIDFPRRVVLIYWNLYIVISRWVSTQAVSLKTFKNKKLDKFM